MGEWRSSRRVGSFREAVEIKRIRRAFTFCQVATCRARHPGGLGAIVTWRFAMASLACQVQVARELEAVDKLEVRISSRFEPERHHKGIDNTRKLIKESIEVNEIQ